MPELSVSRKITSRGLQVIVLENRLLKLQILPEAGAKIWQITYRPLETNLLWNNPHISPRSLPLGSHYDDRWSGGWDELFPNDEVATIDGGAYPDHGELWTGEWEFETFSNGDEVGVKLQFLTPVSSIRVEKTIVIRRDSARVQFHHRFTNLSRCAFPFLWKLHPAFDVSPRHRIDFPPMQVVLEPSFPGTLSGAQGEFPWPYARIGASQVDLRCVPRMDTRQLYFFYGTNIEAGWCALTNTATGLACGLRFDPEVFRSCWLFASYGGWRNHNVAVVEPCTGYPLNFEAMQKANRHKTLGPGETFSTDVLFSAQERLTSVGYIDAEGTISAEPVHSLR